MPDDTDDISVDLANVKEQLTSFLGSPAGKTTITVALILIPLLIGLFIRLQPVTGGNIERIAEANVDRQLQQRFGAQVRANTTGVQPGNLQSQVQQRVQQYKDAQAQQYEQRVNQVTDRISDQFQKPDGEPYLIAIDPYFHWRQTQNVLDHGYGADTMKNGTKWNTHQLAPLGSSQELTELHPLLTAGLSNIITPVTGASPYQVFYVLPAVIGALAAIPAFVLGRRLGGRLGGFIAATITASHQVFVSRSVAGFSDTDAYNITLPLFIFWFTVEALTATTTKRRIAYGAGSVIATGVLAKTWLAWWLTYILVFVTAAAVFGRDILRHAKQLYDDNDLSWTNLYDATEWNTPLTAAGIIVGGAAAAAVARGSSAVTGLIGSVVSNVQIGQAAKANLWPNVFTTVAELGGTNFSTIIGSLGSGILVYAAFLSTTLFFLPRDIETDMQQTVYYTWLAASAILFAAPFLFQVSVSNSVFFFILPIIAGYTITIFEDKERVSVAMPVFLTAWMTALLVASVRGTRFIMILLPAYAIALGTGVGWAFNKLVSLTRSYEDRDTTYALGIAAGIVLLIGLLVPYNVQASGWEAGKRLPSMNDAWYDSLEGIENRSADDAIITSWWDFGHWFKQVADRPVTFDGATQNTPNAHWVGRALQTSSEDEATSILRMLHCGNKKGFNELLEAKHDVSQGGAGAAAYLDTKQVIDEALTYEDRSRAASHYEANGLTPGEASRVAGLTHCDPPENYLITSDDMVGKGGVWGHFGLWDFGKAYAAQTYDAAQPQETIDRYAENINVSEETARQYYLDIPDLNSSRQRNQWISPYPQYATRSSQRCQATNTTLTCDVNINLGENPRRGVSYRLEQVTAPLAQPGDAEYIVGIYNTRTQFRQGQREWQPSTVSVGDGNTIRTVENDDARLGLGVLLHDGEDGWEVVVASPELTTSMFTRLYFLDGAYTEDFELVSDEQSNVAGNRIKVWTMN